MTKREVLTSPDRGSWLDNEEASQLYDLARSAIAPIREIAPADESAAWLLKAGAAAGHHAELLQCTEPVPCHLLVIRAPAADLPRLLETHAPLLIPGGVLAVQNATWPDNQAAVSQWFSVEKRHKGYIRRGTAGRLAVIARRRLLTPHRVFLALPGPAISFATVQSVLSLTDSLHTVQVANAAVGTFGFQLLYTQAINAHQNGEISHFAMLHSDVQPMGQWLDILLDDMGNDYDLVSAVSAIKDNRGLSSSGVGDLADPWTPHRRWTMKELQEFPEVFTAADAGYPDRVLLHNNACFAVDLRSECWRKTGPDGALLATHQFPSRTAHDGHWWVCRGESEDWYYSRTAHLAGARSAITRRVRMVHTGSMPFTNWQPWGKFEVDEDTRSRWDIQKG